MMIQLYSESRASKLTILQFTLCLGGLDYVAQLAH